MKKILFFIESLVGGGAEKSLTELVESLDKSKYDITVITGTDGEFFTERVSSICGYRCFAKRSGQNNRVKGFINKLIFKFSNSAPAKIVYSVLIGGKFDVEIAYCEGYATKLIANSSNRKSRKIAFVHTDMQKNHWTQSVFKSLEEETACYKKFNVITCVSETAAQAFKETFGITENVVVNYNPVRGDLIAEKAKEPADLAAIDYPRMITAGSLTAVKGFDRLLCAANRLKTEKYKFELLILGEGEEEQELKKYIEDNKLSDYVRLTGFQSNPYKYIAGSDFFVCSSYAEGFSTIATECVILGKPVITTDCAGMAELFGACECGIICENSEEALVEALKQVLENPECLQRFSEGSKKRTPFFDIEKSVKEIEKLF